MYWKIYDIFTKIMDWVIPVAFLGACIAVTKAFW